MFKNLFCDTIELNWLLIKDVVHLTKDWFSLDIWTYNLKEFTMSFGAPTHSILVLSNITKTKDQIINIPYVF